MTEFNLEEYVANKEKELAAPPSPQIDSLNAFNLEQYVQQKEIEEYDQLQAQYGTGIQQAKTAAISALSAATLGGFDQALVRSGAMTPEEIRKGREANPGVDFTGKVAGGGFLLGLTGGLAGPIEAGQIAAGTSPFLARALGWGTEGAIFGIGDAISDHALGDPSLNAEKLLAHVGTGFVGGAALGSLFKGIGALPAIARKTNPATQAAKALEENGLNVGANKKFAEEVEKNLKPENLKENYKEIKQSGVTLDNTYVPDGSLIKNEELRKKIYDVTNSGSPIGVAERELYIKSYEDATKSVSNALGASSEQSLAELGNTLENNIGKAFEEKYAPIKQKYQEIEALTPSLKINEEFKKHAEKDILKIIKQESLAPNSEQANFIRVWAEGVKTLEELKMFEQYRVSLGQEVQGPHKIHLQRIAGIIRDKLDDLETLAIKDNAKRIKDGALRSQVEGLSNKLLEVRKEYGHFRGEMEKIATQVFGKNAKVYGPKNFLKSIEGATPESFAKGLFNKNNSRAFQWMATNFPEETRLLGQFEKDNIRREASKAKEGFNALTASKYVLNDKQLPKEFREIIFSPEELEKFKAGKIFFDNFLANFNPSGSGTYINKVRPIDYILHPQKAFSALGNDALSKFQVKRATGLTVAETNELAHQAERATALNSIKNIIDSYTLKLERAAKAVFTEDSKNAGRGAALTGVNFLSEKEYDNHVKKIKELAQNPNYLLNYLDTQTEGLNIAAPNISQAVSSTMINSIMYLNSKIPMTAGNMYLSPKTKTSMNERVRFGRIMNATTNPISILNSVKNGSLTNDELDAVKAVHPKTLQQMQQQVMEHMNVERVSALPYDRKQSMAKFFGQPLDENMVPISIQSNQVSLTSPSLSKEAGPKEGRNNPAGGLKNLDVSKFSGTRTQRVED